MNAAEKRNRQIENAVFLIPFVSYAYFYQGSDQSVACRFDLMRSMLEKGTLWIDDFCGFNTADIIKFGPHIYSVKAPGTSFTALIPWAAIKLALTPLQANHEEMFWAFATYLTTLATTGLLTALMCLVMYRFARFLGAPEGRAAGIAMILGLGTIAFPYATELTGEPVAAVTSFCGFYLVATFTKRSSIARAFFGGFLAGWAVLNDYPVFLAAAAIGIYALFKLPAWKDVAAFSAGAAITAIVLFAYNWGAFGSPLFFSYQAFKLPENAQFPEQAVGFVGLTYPKIRILWNVLLDPQRGLLFCNPVLLLTIPAVAYFARQLRWRAEFAVTVFAFMALILFNASYGESIVSWGGGTATGPRQIVAAIPFMVLTLAFLPAASDLLLGALAFVSVAIMLMATATNPHFPYEYENPVRDFALQQFMRGDFATNRDSFFGGGMLFGDSIAFNLGTLLRLPGPMQLWPLAAWWIIGAFDFAESLQLWGRKTTRHLIAIAASIGIASIFLLSMSAAILQPYELSRPNGLLGRYMVGDNCADSPPHIVRVDPQLDFVNIGHMGAMPFPSCTVWKGQLIAPTAGDYRFAIDVDDSGWVAIDGVQIIRDPGNTSKPHEEGTIHLTAGRHLIEVGQRNLAGDAYIHLFWQPPGAGGPEIIPSKALIPERLDHAAR
ncbi:MAG: PA14 domain-containing protein [Candidatus Binatus sp.]|uniref:PA14 domain-containing protein n=1 Tax=Candidatus Binatus sp. TaxID=2811406 RepID=UPI002722444F|nr:PA14 domain-containing protein [Candidatus Binatus sp.]MDO8433943.1 PA14 domain-containing protein [Candidatus Binatus sp.]